MKLILITKNSSEIRKHFYGSFSVKWSLSNQKKAVEHEGLPRKKNEIIIL